MKSLSWAMFGANLVFGAFEICDGRYGFGAFNVTVALFLLSSIIYRWH